MIKRTVTISVLSVLIILIVICGYLIINKANLTPTVLYLSSSESEDEEVGEAQPTESLYQQESIVGMESMDMESNIEPESSLVSWDGEWRTREQKSSSDILTIQDVTDSSFSFQVKAGYGTNGKLEGTAKISGQRAIAEFTGDPELNEKCLIKFTMSNMIIEIEQNVDCYLWTEAGDTFAGTYEFEPAKDSEDISKENENGLVGIVFETPEQDERFQNFVGEDYSLFADNFMVAVDLKDKDGLGATVKAGYIEGLASTHYGIIMFNDNYMWAAVSEIYAEDTTKTALKYYTNHPDYHIEPPKTINEYTKNHFSFFINQSVHQ